MVKASKAWEKSECNVMFLKFFLDTLISLCFYCNVPNVRNVRGVTGFSGFIFFGVMFLPSLPARGEKI